MLLVALVFFSANTVYFLDDSPSAAMACIDHSFHFDFDHVREKTPYLNVKSAILGGVDRGVSGDRVKPGSQPPRVA